MGSGGRVVESGGWWEGGGGVGRGGGGVRLGLQAYLVFRISNPGSRYLGLV